MLLRSSIPQSSSHPQPIFLSPSSFQSNSLPFPSGFLSSPLKSTQFNRLIVISCSSSPVSKVHSYGTVDYERNGPTTSSVWKPLYNKMAKVEEGAGRVLNDWENKGKEITKFDLSRLVKQLRKFRRHNLALEVHEWMNNRPERFSITSSDTAIQLDLVSKVHGISVAENYFKSLPHNLTDKRTYTSLLNAYVRSQMTEKAEALLVEMKEKNYLGEPLPFNVMMTLYMKLKDAEKVDFLVLEMMQSKVPLDVYSYNIWISAAASQGSIEKMEEVFEKMKLDRSVNPNWTTYSTLATMYSKLGELEKAADCLRTIESNLTGRDRIPFHYLLSHYANLGKKEEVHRIWKTYKTVFPYIPNMGYHSAISSFIKFDDIEEAERLYREWLSIKSRYDPRIGNLVLGWYVRSGLLEKADAFFKEMLEVGKVNSSSWEIIAEGHIKEGRFSDALSCLEKAVSSEGWNFWKPKAANISSIYMICEQENDEGGKEALLGVLRQLGILEDEAYMSSLPFFKQSNAGKELLEVEEGDGTDDEGADVLLNVLEASM